jgi:hypothetical protein
MGLVEVSECDITRVSCVICFLCLFYYCFYLPFSEDLTVVRKYIYTIKIYCCCYFLAVFLYKCMTWWFLLMYFLLKFLLIFLL